MDKLKYIDRFNKIHNRIYEGSKKDFKIDDDYVYHNWDNEYIKYSIDKIISLYAFYNKARLYVLNLKINDIISYKKYGSKTDKAKILKINYKKKLSKNGDKIISSIKVKNIDYDYTSKIDMIDIVYDDILLDDILQVIKMFFRYYFFSIYDIKKADNILNKIREVV